MEDEGVDKKSLRYADFFLLEFILWFLKFTDAVFCFVLFSLENSLLAVIFVINSW